MWRESTEGLERAVRMEVPGGLDIWRQENIVRYQGELLGWKCLVASTRQANEGNLMALDIEETEALK